MISNLQGLIALLLGVVSLVGGAIAWYSASIKKQYAAERDFQHLQRNYQQVSGLLDSLCKEVEEIRRTQADLVDEVTKVALGNLEVARIATETKAIIVALGGQWMKGV